MPLDTSIPDDSGSTEPDSLSLLSLNLHCLKQDGTPFGTLEERLAAVAQLIGNEEVQAVAVQEACVAGAVDALELLRVELERVTAADWDSAWTFAHTAWEGTADEAEEGVGLLVRDTVLEPIAFAYVAPGALRRVGLAARLPQGPLLVSTHLEFDDPVQREDQARQTASWAVALADGPEAIVAGDLNDTEGSPTHEALLQWGFVDASDELDPGRIDHVLVHRGASWRPVDAQLVLTDPPVSDHPGVLVRLEAVAPDPVPITRITATIDVGFGRHLAVRGDAWPLSWDRGWWAYPTASDRWTLVLTEVTGAFSFKTLIDDATWQTGDDVTTEAGDDVQLTPEF